MGLHSSSNSSHLSWLQYSVGSVCCSKCWDTPRDPFLSTDPWIPASKASLASKFPKGSRQTEEIISTHKQDAKKSEIQIIIRKIVSIYIYTWIFIGYKFLSRADFGLISDHFLEIYHFKIKLTISRKNMPLHVFIFELWWICPGISALFPGISAFFPGNFRPKKSTHFYAK